MMDLVVREARSIVDGPMAFIRYMRFPVINYNKFLAYDC